MNVHSIINACVKSVSPNQRVTIRRSLGYRSNPDLSRVPVFEEYVRWAQVQPMSSDDIRMTDGLNLQGYHRHIWINGQVEGLVRGAQTGGDFVVTSDGRTWKVAHVLEAWPDWCSAIITLQVGSDR